MPIQSLYAEEHVVYIRLLFFQPTVLYSRHVERKREDGNQNDQGVHHVPDFAQIGRRV